MGATRARSYCTPRRVSATAGSGASGTAAAASRASWNTKPAPSNIAIHANVVTRGCRHVARRAIPPSTAKINATSARPWK